MVTFPLPETYRVPFTDGVDHEDRRLLERAGEESACGMALVMADVVDRLPQAELPHMRGAVATEACLVLTGPQLPRPFQEGLFVPDHRIWYAVSKCFFDQSLAKILVVLPPRIPFGC